MSAESFSTTVVAHNRGTDLPEFSDPPVNETALSIQFAPLKNFSIAHFGLYWATIRERFPKVQVQPPLPSVIEQFDVAFRGPPRYGVQFVTQPEIRCWFVDEPETRLIQIQIDRFIHNWRKVKGDEVYPHYPDVRNTLEREWRAFCEFLEGEHMETPQVNQCEVTYVNHIEYGRGWNSYEELNSVLRSWSKVSPDAFLPAPEKVGISTHYCLPDNAGRLHVSIDPVVRTRDSKEVLQMTLTARGAPKSSSSEDILEWINLGREWIVKGFTDITTQTMHELWGRKV